MSACLSSRTSETHSINMCWDKRLFEKSCRIGRYGVRIPSGARDLFSPKVYTSSATHTA